MMALTVFSLMIIGAEMALTYLGAIPAVLVDGVALLGLVNYGMFYSTSRYRRISIALALIPVLRILSLAAPVNQIPEIYWYVITGIPFLATMILLSRTMHFKWDFIKLRLGNIPVQILVGLTGVPLGLLAFEILKPKPLIQHLTWLTLAIGSVILFLFVGFLEEVLFRGILQQAALEVFGFSGMILTSILYAALYSGSSSIVYVLFVGITGFLYALLVKRSGTIWGAIAARSFWAIGLILIWPILL